MGNGDSQSIWNKFDRVEDDISKLDDKLSERISEKVTELYSNDERIKRDVIDNSKKIISMESEMKSTTVMIEKQGESIDESRKETVSKLDQLVGAVNKMERSRGIFEKNVESRIDGLDNIKKWFAGLAMTVVGALIILVVTRFIG